MHFVSLPDLSFMSAFKTNNESIHLLNDRFMYHLFEQEIRGGLTFVNTHHAQEKEMQIEDKTYEKVFMYIDKNNLHGAQMCEYLPQQLRTLDRARNSITLPRQSALS